MKKNIFTYALMTLFCFCATKVHAQFYSVSTNIPVAATSTLNMELSMTLDRKWSVHLPVYYNPFVYDSNNKLQNFTVLPGIRYWQLESYIGGFIAANAIGSKYHFTWKNSRYKGEAYGLGISTGYAFMLSPHWNLELEAGIGLIWADYTEYPCEKCGQKTGRQSRWYAIPNKLGVSLVYLF